MWNDDCLSGMTFREARRVLHSPRSGLSDKRMSIRFFELHKSFASLVELSRALAQQPDDEEIVRDVIRAFRNIKRTGPLCVQPIYCYSIIGIVFKLVDEFFGRREWFDIASIRPFDELLLLFDFPPNRPFVEVDAFIAGLADLLTRKHVSATIRLEKMNDVLTRGEISLSMRVELENLTEFWRILGGSYDFPEDHKGYYRPLTREEIIRKVEVRARSVLLGMRVGSPEQERFVRYVYGAGSEEAPGLLNVVRNPARHGAAQLIEVESYETVDSSTGRRRCDNRCSYFELQRLGWANPFFSYYIQHAYVGIQRWIYLARAAGSVFSTSYMDRVMSGVYDDAIVYLSNVIFPVSTDTMGVSRAREISTEISKLTGSLDHHDPAMGEDVLDRVVSYQALRLTMFRWFRERYLRSVRVEVGGQHAFVLFRRCEVHRDESHGRHELMPLFDRLGPRAKVVGHVRRRKGFRARAAVITEAVLHGSEGSPERVLSAAERAAIVTLPPEGGAPTPGIGTESDLVYPYAITELYQQLVRARHLEQLSHTGPDGEAIVPRVCIVDEVADGSWNTLLAFTIEELTRRDEEDFGEGELRAHCRQALGRDLWALRSADPYGLTEEQVAEWQRLEETLKRLRTTEHSVDAVVFIGQTRSPGAHRVPGYPCLRVESLVEDFELSREEAASAVRAASHGADFIPHPFMVDPERAALLPIYGDIPLRQETCEVHIGAYLKELVLYNGIVNHYKREYKRLCVDKLFTILREEQYSLSAKREALEALRRFSYPEIVYRLAELAAHGTGKARMLASILSKTARKIFADVMADAFQLDEDRDEPTAKNVEKMLHRENIARTVAQSADTELRAMAQRMAQQIEEAKRETIVLAMRIDRYLQAKPDAVHAFQSATGIFLAAVTSGTREGIAAELRMRGDAPSTRTRILRREVGFDEVKRAYDAGGAEALLAACAEPGDPLGEQALGTSEVAVPVTVA